jgi:hypothetical protein
MLVVVVLDVATAASLVTDGVVVTTKAETNGDNDIMIINMTAVQAPLRRRRNDVMVFGKKRILQIDDEDKT